MIAGGRGLNVKIHLILMYFANVKQVLRFAMVSGKSLARRFCSVVVNNENDTFFFAELGMVLRFPMF